MKNINNFDFLLSDLTQLSGVGKKTMNILRKKKITSCLNIFRAFSVGPRCSDNPLDSIPDRSAGINADIPSDITSNI